MNTKQQIHNPKVIGANTMQVLRTVLETRQYGYRITNIHHKFIRNAYITMQVLRNVHLTRQYGYKTIKVLGTHFARFFLFSCVFCFVLFFYFF